MDLSRLWHKKRIENKQRLAEYRRQYWQGQGRTGELPQGTGPLNRDGMPKVPPGQYTTQKWPVLDLGVQPDIDKNTWRLVVEGCVQHAKQLTWHDLMTLPQTRDISDFHCVTSWSRLDVPWQGVRFSHLASEVAVLPSATHVLIHAYDGYSTNLPLEEALKYDVLIVHSVDGGPLPREHGGPARMITPQLYAWKGAKWIHRIEFLDHEIRGFWELRGYSNTAEPWLNDRYAADENPT